MNDITRIRSGLDAPNLLPDAEFMEQMKEIIDRTRPGTVHSRGRLKESGAQNKIKDTLGERNALAILKRKYLGAGVLEVARRGTDGAPVLDGLLETPDGRFIVVEAKWSDKGKPTLGKIKRAWINDGSGWKAVNLPKSVTQMSPGWVEAKIQELKAIHGEKYRELALRVEHAFQTKRVVPYLVTTDDVGEVRTVENLLETAEWRDYRKLAISSEQAVARGVAGNRLVGRQGAIQQGTFEKGGPVPKAPRVLTPKDATLPDITTGGARVARGAERLGKLKLGFGADLIVSIATELLFGILESRLSEVNEEGIRKIYKSKVYNGRYGQNGESLAQLIKESVDAVRQGVFSAAAKANGINPKRWMYLVYKYDVLMERQAKTLADAIIVIARRFVFAEVFRGIDPVGSASVIVSERPLIRVIESDKPKEIRADILRYRYTHRLLVWDPEAARLFYQLRERQSKLATLAAATMNEALIRSEAIAWLPAYMVEIPRLIEQYAFRTAINTLEGHSSSNRNLPRIPDRDQHFVKQLKDALRAADLLLTDASRWQDDRKTVLLMYLNADPFESRRSEVRAEQQRERERKASEALERSAAIGRPLW